MASRLVGADKLRQQLEALEQKARRSVTRAVHSSTRALQLKIRADVHAMFPGSRKPGNAIRSVTYPEAGRLSRRPAGIVFSAFGRREAGVFIDYLVPYLTGAHLKPRRGRYLAIPTANVPRRRGFKGGGQPMSPQEVEQAFGRPLRLVRTRRGGRLLVMDEATQGVSRKSGRLGRVRAASERARRTGRTISVPMFWLVASVEIPRRLRIDSTGELTKLASRVHAAWIAKG